MPEGDTIAKVAAVLRRELDGEVLTRCLVRGVYGSERLAGARVIEVETLGKHLIVHLDRDLQIRVHLGMRGSWHRYPHGAKWKRSPSSAAVVLETENIVLVCFNALDIEVIPTPQRQWHRQLGNLGPDLLAKEEPDWDEITKRCARLHLADDPLGEILLDQRIAAGIGNVYKSELAFMGPLTAEGAFAFSARPSNPWQPWTSIPIDDLQAIFARARILLQANLGGWFRTTRIDRRKHDALPDGDLYVYGRAGEPCFRCGEKIERGFQGLQNRVTYWCPGCQPSSSTSGSA